MGNSSTFTRTTNKYVPNYRNQSSAIPRLEGMFIATVTNTYDSLSLGRIEVRIGALATNGEWKESTEDGYRLVSLVTPFGGTTNPSLSAHDATAYGTDGTSEGGSPKSYGMWPQPPVVGTEVVVAFMPYRSEGLLIGSMMSKERNHMMGGRASGKTFGGQGNSSDLAPTSEKNPYDQGDDLLRAADPAAYTTLKTQGLHDDYARGHSQSSARRESPSHVFGITTMNGHVLTMDDGDTAGKSNNIRLRSKNGAQILIDDTNEFIFVNNHDGSSWIEIDSQGRIDVYSRGDISMHTEKDFNIHANGNINMQADKNINIKSLGTDGIRMATAVGSIDISSAQHLNMFASLTTNILSSHHVETANRIDMNGPRAKQAKEPIINSQEGNKHITTSVSGRVPEHHPWAGATTIQEDLREDKGNSV